MFFSACLIQVKNFEFWVLPLKKGKGKSSLVHRLPFKGFCFPCAMMKYDPNERTAAHQTLQHPSFQELWQVTWNHFSFEDWSQKVRGVLCPCFKWREIKFVSSASPCLVNREHNSVKVVLCTESKPYLKHHWCFSILFGPTYLRQPIHEL